MSARAKAGGARKAQNRNRTVPVLAVLLLLALGLLAWWAFAGNRSGTSLGQLGGDFHALHVAPDGRVIYGQHGGIQISTDGGETWTQPSGTGDAMAISASPEQPTVLYQAGHDLFLKSTDGGETWSEPGFGNLPGTDIHGFTVSPESGWLYANVAGQGLYRSENEGESWEFVTSAAAGAMTLAAGPGSPAVLYALTMDQGLIRSDDGGNSWQPTELVPGMSMSGLYVHPESGDLYTTGREGVYLSTDQGESWTALGPDEPMALVAADSNDESTLMAVAQGGQVYRSDNGGETWLR